MRSPPKTITNRVRDAESELNLPPGFRFHPTDEELIVHYLCRKSRSMSGTATTVPPPLSIIADIDLYKHEPWELPEMALFGTKEWYFFTPRDKKYPNGSRPNRVTGNGYWKATGADKPIKSKSDPNMTVGIKKALVFYSGKGTKGIKTNWIMHEYRLTNVVTTSSSKLNDWVLCRLYNKKNNPKEMIIPNDNANIHQIGHDTRPTSSPLDELQKGTSYSNNSDSLNSFEYSDDGFSGSFDGDVISLESSHKPLTKVEGTSKQQSNMRVMGNLMKIEDNNDDGNDWFDSLSLEDLHNCLEALPPNHDIYEMPMFYCPNQQHFPN